MNGAQDTLIVGIGNPLREDDGAGFAVASRLGPPALAVVQLTPELAEPIGRASRVVFVDAHRGTPPGEVHWEPIGPAAPGVLAFSHRVTPADLLAAATLLGGRTPAAWLVAIGGARFGWGEALSPAVEAAVAGLVERLRAPGEERRCTTLR